MALVTGRGLDPLSPPAPKPEDPEMSEPTEEQHPQGELGAALPPDQAPSVPEGEDGGDAAGDDEGEQETATPDPDADRDPADYHVSDLPDGATPDPIGNTAPVPVEEEAPKSDV